MDDTLDYVASEEQFGKCIGHDLEEGKITLPLIHTLKHCTPAEREQIGAIVDKELLDKSDFQTVFDLVHRYGGIDYAVARARDYIAEGKALAKRMVRTHGILTPDYLVMHTGKERVPRELGFPLLVKPVAEGTSKGVTRKSIVHTEDELREAARELVGKYRQPALAEQYIAGREFTVGILGRPDAKLYSRHPQWYDKDGFHRFPILELDSSRSVTPNVYSQAAKSMNVGDEGAPGYVCPAEVDPELEKKLKHYAWRAHMVLGALDVSRTDIRLDDEGTPRLLEINTLPGLTPDGRVELDRLLDELPTEQRAVFVLRTMEDMPYEAIAEALSLSPGTVMSRLFRAREKLARALAPYLGPAARRKGGAA